VRLASFDRSSGEDSSGDEKEPKQIRVTKRTSSGTAPTTFSGSMHKRLHMAKWGVRFFQLENGVLSYYSDARSRVLRKQLKLEGSTLRVSVQKPYIGKPQFHIRMSHPKWDRPLQTFVMVEAERDDWVAHLTKAGATLVTGDDGGAVDGGGSD